MAPQSPAECKWLMALGKYSTGSFFVLQLIHHISKVWFTCQVPQAKFPEPEVAILPVVEEYGQGVALLVELGATDDAQVLQG